jgi:uncharacterized membrane protein HdeD (DUF308 family)
MRWALGLSGALSVAFGIAILVWPDISLYALVLVFGAFTSRAASSDSRPPSAGR